jgi:aromatic-L-amino-acid decarboxylase
MPSRSSSPPCLPALSSPQEVRAALGGGGLPEAGAPASELLAEAGRLLFEHSTLNGHPRFLAYITASGAPIGGLGDLLAATVNPNTGIWPLSPFATELEVQTIRWIAELLGYPHDCGGILVSGGNMANFIGLLAARRAQTSWDVRVEGLAAREGRPLHVYTSTETHAWIQKATDIFGLGTQAIRWIETDAEQRMRVPRGGNLVPRRRRLRSTGSGSARRAPRPRGVAPGGLGRCRSSQMAIRASRSRMRSRPRPTGAA